MDPSTTFCPNLDCPDKGQQGRGNIGIHSQKERRYWCKTCHATFAATRGTAPTCCTIRWNSWSLS